MEIRKTNDCKNNYLKFFVYGQSGIGKTYLARTIPERTLLISSEQGLLSLNDISIDYVDITAKSPLERLKNLGEVYKRLANGIDYKWLFIDTISEIGLILIEYLQEKYPDKKDSMNLWSDYYKTMKNLIRQFRDVPYNVVFICHEQVDKDEMQIRFILPDLNGKIASQVPIFFDEVFRYTMIKTENNSKRVLVTTPHNNCMAKDRSGKLNQFEIPDLTIITNKIRANAKEQK